MGTNINQVLKELCQDLGYKKKGYLFYKQLTSEVSSTVGFNISSGQTITHRSVAPQIGVRYETVENYWPKLQMRIGVKCFLRRYQVILVT